MLRALLLLVALWWLLTGGGLASWVLGVPSIGAALLVRHRLDPLASASISPVGVVRFVAGFLRQSFVSGLDVVRRAFHPRLPLAPGWIDYALRLRSPTERILLAGTVNLLPGTLSADLHEDNLTLHVLDLDAQVLREVQQIEARVAGLHAAPAPNRVSGDGHDHG